MPSLNRVLLIGRLTRDPEIRTTASGLTVAKFGLAVDRRFKNPQGERVTDFFDCSAFRQKAEFVEQYVHKGRLVAVEGSIELNEASGQDGIKRRYVNIIVDNIETLDRAGDDSGGGGGGGGASRDSEGGYYPEEEPEERPAPARPAARAAAPERGGDRDERPARDAAPARPAARPAARAEGGAARPARAAAKPAEPMYPADDFDDSDPFADE